eukprot:764515-Hanusia_phi.AAC.4
MIPAARPGPVTHNGSSGAWHTEAPPGFQSPLWRVGMRVLPVRMFDGQLRDVRGRRKGRRWTGRTKMKMSWEAVGG